MARDRRQPEAPAQAQTEAGQEVSAPATPAWRKSSRSGTNPHGNCVETALIPAAGGVCNCGGDPNCGTCGGTGSVWILL